MRDDLPRNAKGQRVCGARARTRGGEPCQSTALGPSGRCRMHNGWAASGVRHPGFKTGKWGKYARTIRAFLDDPAALEHRRDAALINARVDELVALVARGDVVTASDLQAAWAEFRAAATSRDAARVTAAADRMNTLVGRATDVRRAWVEIERLILSKASLVEREPDRRLAHVHDRGLERAREKFSQPLNRRLGAYLVGDTYRQWPKRVTYRLVQLPDDPNEKKKLGNVIGLFIEWRFIEWTDGESTTGSRT